MRLFEYEEPPSMKSKYLKIKYNRSKLDWYWAPLFIAFWFLLFYLVVFYSFHYGPDILSIQHEASQPGSFIGERAKHALLRLSKIGPKVVGSPANEQGAVHILLSEIGSIKQEARLDLYDIEHEVQVASGNYPLRGIINAYQSIQNVIVRVSPRNLKTNASLLINSHYDSVPGSPGAGDAGFMIAVMLETLRVITKFETPLRHSIVFLFNGAEENPLQGSHAFITLHKWAKQVRAFINLDSAGSGGREILFQAGPNCNWLLKYYGENVVHPFATTLAGEMFERGLVPSDTDFRIFRDYGKVPGLDMATIFNGYVYHTKYDRFDVIPSKSFQSTGDNVLALTKALANAPELEDDATMNAPEGGMVFYDVLGWFMIYYSETASFIINISVSILAVITILVYIWNMAHQTGMFRRRIFAKFGILFGIQVATVIVALLFTMGMAFVVDAVGLSMSWFSQKWMIFGLYFCPMYFVLGIIPAAYLGHTKEHFLPLGYSIQLIMHAHCLIMVTVLIALTCLGIRSAFIVMICVAFYTLSVLLNIVTCFHNKSFYWLIPHFICQVLPFLFLTYVCCVFFDNFIPMLGRSGSQQNPELLIGGFTALMCLLFASFLVPLLWLFRKSKLIISCFAVIFIVFLILAATPVSFPYIEKEAPQRFQILHTVRTFHNGDPEMSIRRNDSGFYVIAFDRQENSIHPIIVNENTTFTTPQECEEELLCGLPAVWLKRRGNTFWVPGPAPNKDGWPILRILDKQSTSLTTILYTLEISGPDHIGIYLKPLPDTKLVDWSFDREILETNKSRPYLIQFSYALDPAALRFNLEFERNSTNWTGPAFDLAVIGHKMHHDIFNTEEFREFLAKFPPWTHTTAWTSSYESWRL